MKRRLMMLAAVALLAAPAAFGGDGCSGDVAALRALYAVREAMWSPYASSYDVSRRIDEMLDQLREPLADGGYRWVRYVRPSGDAPVVKKEHTVRSEFEQGDPDSFEASAAHPFAVKVVVPRKRSLTKANSESYVGTLEVRYSVNGKEKTLTKTIDQWMAPDTSKSFDLGVIADQADATLTASARNADRKESLVEIHFKQAVAQDDPQNPAFDAVQALKRVSGSTSPATLDLEIARFERSLFPTLTSVPYATLVANLRDAQKLLASSKEEEQEKGKKLLEKSLKTIQ